MKKVLVVEDSTTYNKLLTAAIQEGTGFECVQAYSLAQAQDILNEEGDSFFCATVDINLPDACEGDSVDLILQYDHIAPIVITGQLSDSLRESMLQKSVADYVLKRGQYDVDYVVSLIHRLHKNAQTKVLVVDDSLVARKQMRRLLSIQRYQVFEARSGQEALAVLHEHPDIRLSLLDNHMEGMDGTELATKIRATHCKDEMVIIGVSSQRGQELSAKFIKSGANDFLIKPFQPEEFNCRVNQNVDFMEQIAGHKNANELKNQLLGTAAHDIRGPISVIQGAAQLLKQKKFDAEKKEQFLDMILNSSTKMITLLNDLLDISAIESGKVNVEPVQQNLADLVHERVEFYRNIADKKEISLSEYLCNMSLINYDPSRIEQVVDNLISNAIKYAPLNSNVDIVLEDEGDWQRLDVIDSGPGISESNVPKLFGAFQKLGSSTTGGESSTGLGLAICKNMVEAHNGQIGYEHNPDGGSCFFVKLPGSSNSASL